MGFIIFSKKKYLLFSLVLFVLMSCPLLNSDIPINEDSPYYLVLGQSIASGQGYKDIYYPGNPPNTSYPNFFYPLLLSLILIVFPKTIIGLKLISILFGAGSLILIYIMFSDRIKTGNRELITSNRQVIIYSSLLLLLVATNPWFLGVSVLILTEMTYVFFSLMALLFIERYSKQDKLIGKALFIAAFSMAIVFFTRTIGLSISVAAFVYFMIKHEYKKGFLLTGLLVCLISPWLYRNITILKTEASCSDFVLFFSGHQLNIINFIKIIWKNIIGYGQTISVVLFPGWFLNKFPSCPILLDFCFLCRLINKFNHFCFSLTLCLGVIVNFLSFFTVLFGFLYQIKKKQLVEIYVLFYLVILMVLPPKFYLHAGARYLFPLLPFILYYFWIGCSLFLKKFCCFKTIIKGIAVFFIFIIFVSNTISDVKLIKDNLNYVLDHKYLSNVERNYYYGFCFTDYFLAADWIKKNTSADGIVMAEYPPAFYLWSNRKTVYFETSFLGFLYNRRSLEEIKSTIKRKRVNYIVTKTKEGKKIVFKLNYQCKDTIFVPFVEFKWKKDEDIIRMVYKVVKIKPLVKLKNMEGVFFFNREKYDIAAQKFKKALELEPNFIGYHNLGMVYERKGLIKEAERMYKKVLELEPNYEICKNMLNIISQKEIVKQCPNDVLALEKLGEYYLKNHNNMLAMETFMEVLKLNPNLAIACYNLAITYINTDGYGGEYIWAIEKFREAMKLEPALRYKASSYIKFACKRQKEILFYVLYEQADSKN